MMIQKNFKDDDKQLSHFRRYIIIPTKYITIQTQYVTQKTFTSLYNYPQSVLLDIVNPIFVTNNPIDISKFEIDMQRVSLSERQQQHTKKHQKSFSNTQNIQIPLLINNKIAVASTHYLREPFSQLSFLSQ
ncbi:hypothetical protein ABPG72_011389 [Tetrahymena utriculariae]